MNLSRSYAIWALPLLALLLSCATKSAEDPQRVYAQYDRQFHSFLTKANRGAGKEIIKLEPLSERFTVPQKLTIKGTPYEIGLAIGQIGKQTRLQIPMLTQSNTALNQKVVALYERIDPQFLDLVRGVADVYKQPADKIDLRVFNRYFTTDVWCILLQNGKFYREMDFGRFGDAAQNHHCSAASYYTNGHQLVGRNFDNFSDRPHYFTTLEMTGKYKVMGHTIYDITSWVTDGINEKGLALCVTTAYVNRETYPNEPAVVMGHMCQIIMQTCASVDEALALLQTVRVWFPDEVNHWLLADSSGKSVVVEWNPKDYKLLVFDNKGPYELLTNTPLEKGEEALLANCYRYRKAKPLLESGVHSPEEMFEVMGAMRVTTGPSRTLWTSIMDLNARTFEVRYFKEFERKYQFGF